MDSSVPDRYEQLTRQLGALPPAAQLEQSLTAWLAYLTGAHSWSQILEDLASGDLARAVQAQMILEVYLPRTDAGCRQLWTVLTGETRPLLRQVALRALYRTPLMPYREPLAILLPQLIGQDPDQRVRFTAADILRRLLPELPEAVQRLVHQHLEQAARAGDAQTPTLIDYVYSRE